MSLTADVVGTTYAPDTMTIDAGRLRLFAKATGQTDPVYSSVEAAQAAGHPSLLVPPTFLFGVALEKPDPFAWMTDLGIDLSRVLHGNQSFDYVAPVYAGDTVTSQARITDLQVKKGGALTFIEMTSTITRGGETVAHLVSTTVVRGEGA